MAKGKYSEWLVPDKLFLLECWARDGLSDEQIAKNIGVHISTYYDWKNKYPDFSEALKKGKEVADYEIENALYKKALGFEYEEVKTNITIDKDGNRVVNTTKIKRINPPDTTAGIFWLKHRKPEVWQNTTADTKAKMKAEIEKAEAEAKLVMQQLEQMNDESAVESVVFVDRWDGEDDE